MLSPVVHGSFTILDGFTLLYSCRVKLPHEAIKANVSSLSIKVVNQNDLVFFSNLSILDLSDNKLSSQEEITKLSILKSL
jgi:hypothetical protein